MDCFENGCHGPPELRLCHVPLARRRRPNVLDAHGVEGQDQSGRVLR